MHGDVTISMSKFTIVLKLLAKLVLSEEKRRFKLNTSPPFHSSDYRLPLKRA